jgi:hypothetical protein
MNEEIKHLTDKEILYLRGFIKEAVEFENLCSFDNHLYYYNIFKTIMDKIKKLGNISFFHYLTRLNSEEKDIVNGYVDVIKKINLSIVNTRHKDSFEKYVKANYKTLD